MARKILSLNSCFLITFLVFTSLQTGAQTYQRNASETAEAFVLRITGQPALTQQMIETKEWDSTKKTIIYFQDHEDNTGEYFVGYMLTPVNGLSYHRVLIDTFYTEGGTRNNNVTAIFFANADKDSQRELVIMTSAEAYSPRYADNYEEGTFYLCNVYDAPNMSNSQKTLPKLNAITDKLSKYEDRFEGELHVNKTGKLIKKCHAKYKTAKDVRKALKDMGY